MTNLLDPKENKRIERKARQLAGIKEKPKEDDIQKFKDTLKDNQAKINQMGQGFISLEF